MTISIGLKDLHVCKLIKDDVETLQYDSEIKRIPDIQEIGITPNVVEAEGHADDVMRAQVSVISKYEVTMNLLSMSLEDKAFFLGSKIVNGVLETHTDDTPPEIALGFRSLNSDGTYRYVWLTKGKAKPIEDSYKTKGDNVEFQSKTLTFVFMARTHDGLPKLEAQEGMQDFDPQTWFTTDMLERKIVKETQPPAGE
ncbi:phage major tail protein, phi13 family [Gottschalkia purinilytica]|uniref:Phage major tail protein, phi13 family n=1 Tax=Gottschalkia purinilytica TaxID=1503 RepID=A0A0L0W699_GOTPU|nr:major tail protein [Gottschalkia purinilytica]KNF07006.1 phage major tail protein, phi13 family [Gottschalkia purinilytica]